MGNGAYRRPPIVPPKEVVVRVVFLDRDGVINENRPDHVKSWSEFQFLPGALEALRLLHEAGWRAIVVTNQAIIHRNIVPSAAVDDINQRMREAVEIHGGHIDAVLYCPHRPEENCECRKPRPGLLRQAATQFNLPLDQCYIIGDAYSDIQAGRAVGCRTIMVKTGRGLQQMMTAPPLSLRPHQVVRDLADAATWMVRAERRRQLLHIPDSDLPIDVPPITPVSLFPWSSNSSST